MLLNYEIIFQQLPGYCFIKDIDSTYLTANETFLKMIGLTQRELSGKTDYDMPWARTHATQYLIDDAQVLKGQPKLNYVESQLRDAGNVIRVKVSKTPLYHEHKLIGLTCYFVDYPILNSMKQLSPQQNACLRGIIDGLTAKQIARKLNLSVRTVESYIGILKNKLACRNKADLIRKGMHFLELVNDRI